MWAAVVPSEDENPTVLRIPQKSETALNPIFMYYLKGEKFKSKTNLKYNEEEILKVIFLFHKSHLNFYSNYAGNIFWARFTKHGKLE